MKTILKNPTDLRMHWTRKLLPVPNKAHVDNISDTIASGVKLPPIYIVEPNLVVAGWSRTLACRARQTDVECITLSEDEALAVALGENTNRQSYAFKFQTAFVYCPLALRVSEEAQKRRMENLKRGAEAPRTGNNSGSGHLPETLDDVARLIGVSGKLLSTVKAAYETIVAWDKENDPKCWNGEKQKRTALDFWTSRILDEENPCTPGNAIAGLAGKKAGEDGKTHPAPKQLELFCEGMASIRKWGKSFVRFEGEAHSKAVKAIKQTVAEWPKELREEILTEIKRINREEKETQS